MELKFLLITPTEVDHSNGGAIRSGGIREALAALGVVHTLIYQWGNEEKYDSDWGPDWTRRASYTRHGISPRAFRERSRMRRWIAAVIAEGGYDVIVVRYLYTSHLVPAKIRRRVIVDADDARKSVSVADSADWRKRLKVSLRNALIARSVGKVGHVWYSNPADGARLATRRKSLLPNTVRIPPAHRPRLAPEKGRILMVGLMTYQPNIQGARWFIENVLPALRREQPGVELHIVGKHFLKDWSWLQDGSVRLRGFVENLQNEYDRSVLVVAPIESGGGTQIKVIDALAHARPLVASRFAHGGFADRLRDREHMLVADDLGQWISHCSWVLANAGEAEDMSMRGYEAVAFYGHSSLAKAVGETVRQVAGARAL